MDSRQQRKTWIVHIPEKEQFKLGGVIEKVTLNDCVTEINSPWFFGPVGFALVNPQPLDFTPLKGKLSFFNIQMNALESTKQAIEKALK